MMIRNSVSGLQTKGKEYGEDLGKVCLLLASLQELYMEEVSSSTLKLLPCLCSLNAHYYIMEVLLEYVVRFASHVGENLIVLHDKRQISHCSTCVSSQRRRTEIITSDSPTQCPGRNPIQQVWNMFGHEFTDEFFTPCPRFGQLFMMRLWDAVLQNDIRTLIARMLNRLPAVVDSIMAVIQVLSVHSYVNMLLCLFSCKG